MVNSVILPPDYTPNKKEEYMNEMQLEYFRQKLLDWKKELIAQSNDTLDDLRQGGLNQPDDVDRASLETDKSLDLRTKDRARKLIMKIDQALERIEDGSYGYCEETGEEIGIGRLMARPIATLCVEAQERHERMEKTHDDEA
ncbi:MAG: RNA polymerase-binding protein DksA [Alphaproteobacteria bacterium]|nr:RNA polymerase-binding protein DksA [Alphaproteobacteria bacterium]MBO5442007.1 RNA polymerase-binding protein DksA [Alphaproteobacteria bacterium]MBP3688267.1 RNA polymerase-binding protein DksA [Alphaproteobacteria bacterium]